MLRARLHTSSRVRQFGFYRQEILPSRLGENNKGAIKLKKLCYCSENKTKLVLSLSLTAIEHFHFTKLTPVA